MWYFILTIIFWVAIVGGFTWLVFWILYRVLVAAVRNGILEADAERRKTQPAAPPHGD